MEMEINEKDIHDLVSNKLNSLSFVCGFNIVKNNFIGFKTFFHAKINSLDITDKN